MTEEDRTTWRYTLLELLGRRPAPSLRYARARRLFQVAFIFMLVATGNLLAFLSGAGLEYLVAEHVFNAASITCSLISIGFSRGYFARNREWWE